MIDPFEEIIQQLGESLGITLRVDKNRACLLKIHGTLSVQIQTDSSQEKILIGCFVTELPPGRFRENVLSEALKANHLPDPRTAIFGYLSSGNHLTMHQRYPLALLDGKKLAVLAANFIDYAELWREALQKGQSSPAPITASSTKPTNPFGLR